MPEEYNHKPMHGKSDHGVILDQSGSAGRSHDRRVFGDEVDQNLICSPGWG
jgi:hypothetical protein